MTDGRRQTTDRRPSAIQNSKSLIRNLLWWVFASLIAIVVVEMNTLAGLAVAIVGGIILGIRLFAK